MTSTPLILEDACEYLNMAPRELSPAVSGAVRGEAVDPLFDSVVFGESVRWVMGARGLSFRQAAPLAGVSPATLCRVATGKPPNVEDYLRIREWLGMSAHGPTERPDRTREDLQSELDTRTRERDEAREIVRRFVTGGGGAPDFGLASAAANLHARIVEQGPSVADIAGSPPVPAAKSDSDGGH